MLITVLSQDAEVAVRAPTCMVFKADATRGLWVEEARSYFDASCLLHHRIDR